MMNGNNESDGFASAFTSTPQQHEQECLEEDEEEISFINPFASPQQQQQQMRHRASGQASTYTSSYLNINECSSTFGDASSSLAMMPQQQQPLHIKTHNHPAGATAGFLELEEEPRDEEDLLGLSPQEDTSSQQQVKTSSGLFLTHRQQAPSNNNMPRSRPTYRYDGNNHTTNNTSFMSGEALEVESGGYMYGASSSHVNYNSNAPLPPALQTAKRLLSYVRLWNAAFCIFLIIGTGVVLHSIRHEQQSNTASESAESVKYPAAAAAMKESSSAAIVDSSNQEQQVNARMMNTQNQVKEQIILRPLLVNATQQHRRMMEVAQPQAPLEQQQHEHGIRASLHELRLEFEEWIATHSKVYSSEDEKELRFQIWHDNHHKTIEKNKQHGPCKLTGQPVFGSTYFKDLTKEEFTSQYLTGYKGPHHDELVLNQRKTTEMKVPGSQERAETRRRMSSTTFANLNTAQKNPYQSSSSCSFYDVSCWLQWFMYNYGYGIGGTMEPAYDGDTYPEAVDWREYGAVSSVHSQGSCGACWAITAVETMESANALKTGTLIDLAETEVIVCEEDCEMCNGGWPQNAYDFNMDNGGLLAESSWSYDGDFLYTLTAARDGESENYDASYVSEYQSSVCSQGSGDRYAKIKGYGYATDRCVCYTDGTGCDCDEQNELKALQNVATYGPATVCLEASTWADYAGGILTSDSGCSPSFLDMNHCVQAVGYAFVSTDDDDANEGNNDGSGSGSGSGSGGSRDEGNREGYWIIRNQWSSYWGYDGYIYVAMGDNTCGVLNDMTQVYM